MRTLRSDAGQAATPGTVNGRAWLLLAAFSQGTGDGPAIPGAVPVAPHPTIAQQRALRRMDFPTRFTRQCYARRVAKVPNRSSGHAPGTDGSPGQAAGSEDWPIDTQLNSSYPGVLKP